MTKKTFSVSCCLSSTIKVKSDRSNKNKENIYGFEKSVATSYYYWIHKNMQDKLRLGKNCWAERSLKTIGQTAIIVTERQNLRNLEF